MKVLLLGSTGLVGREVLNILLEDISIERVNILARRSTYLEHSKLTEYIGSLDEMEKNVEAFQVDSVLCCLGTTIKKAGSQEKFKLVDHDYPLKAARLARENNIKSYAVVTALNSSSKSRIFYSRIKGELEDELSQLGFKNLHMIRPSILVGDREEFRMGESIGIWFAKFTKPLFIGALKKYAGSDIEDVASLMVSLIKGEVVGSPIEYETLSSHE